MGQVNIDRNEDKYYTNVLVDSVEFLTPKNLSNRPQNDPFQDDGTPIDVDPKNMPF
ncbi:hypothetical protein D3C80_2233530 [compost metagenome]